MKSSHPLLRVPFPLLLLLVSVPVYFLVGYLHGILPEKATFERFWIIQVIMCMASWMIHLGLKSAAAKSGQAFIRFFMLSSGLKLFAFMVILIVYGIADSTKAFGFIFNFLMLYMVYTILEVWVSFKSFGPVQSPK
ncbi:MAG: hypothetical protein ACKOYC_04530 [Bacteroidota bacterium]